MCSRTRFYKQRDRHKWPEQLAHILCFTSSIRSISVAHTASETEQKQMEHHLSHETTVYTRNEIESERRRRV